jgi:hypothetical protein
LSTFLDTNVASAEASGVNTIASFDRGIERTATVQRAEPA